MSESKAVVESAVVLGDERAVQGILIALAIGIVISTIYVIYYLCKHRKWPATGNVGYLMLEVATIVGIFRIMISMFNKEYFGKLGADEHLFIGIGSVIVIFTLVKKVSRLLATANDPKDDQHTIE